MNFRFFIQNQITTCPEKYIAVVFSFHSTLTIFINSTIVQIKLNQNQTKQNWIIYNLIKLNYLQFNQTDQDLTFSPTIFAMQSMVNGELQIANGEWWIVNQIDCNDYMGLIKLNECNASRLYNDNVVKPNINMNLIKLLCFSWIYTYDINTAFYH